MPHRILIALLLLTAAALAADKTYPVLLERPGKTGQKYDIRFTVAYKDESSRTIGRQPPQVQTSVTAVELDARVEVLAVDARGQESKVAVTVRKCAQVVDQKETEVVPKGTVILAEINGARTVLSRKDRKEITPEQESALGSAISLAPEKARTLDQTYGSKTPRKPGDKWDIDRAAFVEHLAAYGVTVKPDAVKGTVTFIGVSDRDGRRDLQFRVETTIDGYSLKDNEDAKETQMEFKGLTKKQTIEIWVPEDTADISGRASVNMDDHYTFTGKGEGRAAYKADFNTTRIAVMESRMVRE